MHEGRQPQASQRMKRSQRRSRRGATRRQSNCQTGTSGTARELGPTLVKRLLPHLRFVPSPAAEATIRPKTRTGDELDGLSESFRIVQVLRIARIVRSARSH